MWFPTKPLDIKDTPADVRHKGPAGVLEPRRIVLHATAGTNSLVWLTKTSSPPVSVHRLIGRDGTIYKLGDDQTVMYHVGFGSLFPTSKRRLMSGNYTSLGIELENTNDGRQNYPTAQLESCVRQVVEWYGKWGYLPVVSHADVDARKSDPVGFPWEYFMVLVWDSITGLVDN